MKFDEVCLAFYSVDVPGGVSEGKRCYVGPLGAIILAFKSNAHWSSWGGARGALKRDNMCRGREGAPSPDNFRQVHGLAKH